MNLRLSLAGMQLLAKGDPWIAPQSQLSFRGVPDAGQILRVQDANGDFLGWCVSDGPGGQPAFRVLSRERHVDFGAPWWGAQVEQALARRRALALPEGPRRAVHGEADGLPGLAVELSDGVALCAYDSPGLFAFADLIEAALIRQARLRGLWRRDRSLKGWGPWSRSPLLPEGPAQFGAGEPGLPLKADLMAGADGPGLPRPLDRRAWRAWARAEAPGRRVLLLGGLDGEAEAARAAGPAELAYADKGIFKSLAKAAGSGVERAVVDVPAESKESFGRFDSDRHLPRLLKDLAAACAPGAEVLLAGATRPLWHAQPWEEAMKEALPGATPVLQRVIGPEADFPDHPLWIAGRARKAFLFKLV